MHETIFNQKQVLQGTNFIIYSYCKYYRNVFIMFALHTEMDENRCTNGIIRVANYTTFVHRFSFISVCNENIMKTFLIT